METNKDTPIIILVEEFPPGDILESEDTLESLEIRRQLHEIMRLGRAHPVDLIIGSNPDETPAD